MAFGRLGVASLTANTDTILYTVPTKCRYAEVSVSLLNTNVADSSIKVAVSAADVPLANEYIEDGAIVPASGGIIERSSIVASPGERIVLTSSLSGVTARVSGKEIL